MNTLFRTAQAQLAACLITLGLLTLWAQPVWADTRQDALFELERLHQSASVRGISDELKSADATFAIAEHYFQANEVEQSERFYLLALQKARIILAALPRKPADPALATATLPLPPADADIPAPLPLTNVPDDEQQTITVPAAESPSLAADVPETPAVMRDISIPPLEPETGYFSGDITSVKLVGTASTYFVVKGDNIRLVAAKLGVSRQQLIRTNKLDEKVNLKIGQKLIYNNRKIVPQRMKNGIVVNIPDRTLYYFKQGRLAVSLPVALGVPVSRINTIGRCLPGGSGSPPR